MMHGFRMGKIASRSTRSLGAATNGEQVVAKATNDDHLTRIVDSGYSKPRDAQGGNLR